MSDVVELDDLTSGLTTEAELEPIDGARALRVTWIAWDSALRTTDLRIRDRIVAVDGASLHEHLVPGNFSSLLGQATESLSWQESGAVAGQVLSLRVLRGDAQLEITGRLSAERQYRAGDQGALAPGGPARLQNDGFDSPWMSWYEDFTKRMSYVLDYGWVRNAFDNRAALVEHDEWLPRIAYVEQHHPGDFARLLRADWDAARTWLAGSVVDDVDLEYRELGARRLATVREAAASSWTQLRAALGSAVAPVFPLPPPGASGFVELPVLSERDLVNDLGATYAVATDNGELAFVEMSDNAAVVGLYRTIGRFRGDVNPELADRHQYLGRVDDRQRMITVRDSPAIGRMVDVVAARIGAEGECVVDLRAEPGEAGFAFAGEDLLRSLVAPALTDDAPPQAVLEAMVAAIKTADREGYDPLFATWRSWSSDGQAYYDAAYAPHPPSLDEAWQRSRAMITGDVVDVRVAEVGAVRRIVEPDVSVHRPAVDQVRCVVDHVGRFDDGFRTFMTSFVHRTWILQRRDGGPWRITEVQSL